MLAQSLNPSPQLGHSQKCLHTHWHETYENEFMVPCLRKSACCLAVKLRLYKTYPSSIVEEHCRAAFILLLHFLYDESFFIPHNRHFASGMCIGLLMWSNSCFTTDGSTGCRCVLVADPTRKQRCTSGGGQYRFPVK